VDVGVQYCGKVLRTSFAVSEAGGPKCLIPTNYQRMDRVDGIMALGREYPTDFICFSQALRIFCAEKLISSRAYKIRRAQWPLFSTFVLRMQQKLRVQGAIAGGAKRGKVDDLFI
jgi:hypothetical protein